MKTRIHIQLPLIASILLLCIPPAAAQGTAFTYQGRLNEGSAAATGIYDLQFTVYDSTNSPGTVIAGPLTLTAAGVSNGLFTVNLDFGPGVFTGASRWLELAVRTNGAALFTTLQPRQPLTASPYAIYAGGVSAAGISGTIPATSLSGTYSNALTFNNGANSFSGTFYGQFLGLSFIGGSFSGAFIGDGSGLINLNASQLASGIVPDARLPLTAARTNQVWLLNGNAGTVSGTHFLGTTDSTPLELKVANDRVFRLEPAAEVPNIIGGSRSNIVSAGIQGVTIAGGGLPLYRHSVAADFSTIGGGTFHTVNGPWGTIAGGRDNSVHSESATIAGGFRNTIASNSLAAAIAGGWENLVSSNAIASFIGGGFGNSISNQASYATIGGGFFNRIEFNSDYSFIAGGEGNVISSNIHRATVGGGSGNRIHSPWSVIDGGQNNLIETNSTHITIGGGHNNRVDAASWGTTISGGGNNQTAFNTYYAVIGGGYWNQMGNACLYATIGGGYSNRIGFNALTTVIGGGFDNVIEQAAHYSTISGGIYNRIGTNALYSVIVGGYSNLVDGLHGLAAGRQAQALHDGSFVWADSQPLPFSSTLANQFNVRAAGGVRFETAGAGMTVDGQPVIAGTVGGSQLSGTYGNALTFNNPANNFNGTFTGDGSGLSNVNATTVGGMNASQFWQLGGNTAFGGQFLGTTNGTALELRTGNRRVMRFETDGSGAGVHVLGGSRSNRITLLGAFSTVISGGGSDASPNVVSDDYGVVAGGFSNVAGNTNGVFDAEAATVGGGFSNNAAASYATVPGGTLNTASGASSFAAGNQARATNDGAFVWSDASGTSVSSTNNNSVTMRAAGGYRLFSNGGASAGVFLAAGSGTWTSMSDRNSKENFRPVDVQEVLDRVARMPIQTWNYKSQDPSVRHVGPMAQDFKTAFGVGESDTGITTIDADGVALAAIQGLNQKLEEKNTEIQNLKDQNDQLGRKLNELAEMVKSLAEKK